jgi:RNA polymerase sigma-70 factor (family 1)
MLNDVDIIMRFREGDTKAFEMIYERFFTQVLLFAKQYTRREEAEEIVMDNFRKLWDKRSDFQELINIKAFLMIATRNACLNLLYKEKSKAEKDEKVRKFFESRQKWEHEKEAEIEAQTVDYILGQIENLPIQCRTIIKQKIGGAKNRDIANNLNISVHTVKNQVQRGVKLLKIKLLNVEQAVYCLLLFPLLF